MNQQPTSPITNPAGDQTSDQSGIKAARRQRILTPEGKLEVLHLLSLGLSMVEIAKRVGVSTRAIRKAADVDPAFKQRIQRNRGDIDVLTRQTLKEAAGETKYWRCIPLLRELTNLRPQPQLHEQTEEELLNEFRAVLTQVISAIGSVLNGPNQRAQLDRELAKIDFNFIGTLKQSHTPRRQLNLVRGRNATTKPR